MDYDENRLDLVCSKRYGTWPGGLCCALTVDPHDRIPRAKLPLEVWTIEGERQIFIEYRADHPAHRS